MNFKQWLLQLEAIDASTKELLLKAKAPKDQLDAFIKELENEPNLIDKKTAFQRFQSKFNIQKKEKDEDAQRKHFASVPNTTEEELKTYDYYKDENPQALKEMMELLRKFIDKKLITLKIINGIPVLIRNTLQGEQQQNTPDFTRFMSSLHGIQASLNQFKSKGTYFNPIEEELNHQNNLVAKGDNVWVFKGHAPDLCRIYGKGHPWCISSTSSAAHWFSYRINHHQTQYFVFDFNKDENDPARYVNPGVAPEGEYSEWVDADNQHSTDPEDRNSEVGINGYKSIREYKEYLASKGIPLDTWKTTEPEKWEKRLSNYDEDKNFQGAKNDSDPRVFQMYLKIINAIEDYDFEKLTEEQKKEFILGKTALTDKQLNYAFKNFKGEYYNSLDAKEKNELLKKSIIKNYTELIKYLIQKNVEIPNSAVSDVLKNGHLDIVKYLVEKKGAKISDDAVEYAARSGNLALVKYLVEKGANISDDAISGALENDNIVKYLLGDEVKDDQGNIIKLPEGTKPAEIILTSPYIKKLIEKNNLKLLKYLVKKDGILEISDDAVVNAIRKNNFDMVKYLVEYLIKKGKKLSYYPVIAATEKNNFDMVKYLIEKGGIITNESVGNALANNNLEMVKYLLGDEAKDNQGNIIKLPEGTKPEVIRDKGYIYNKFNDYSNSEMFKYLIKKGANINSFKINNAIMSNNLEITKYLIEKVPTLEDKHLSGAIKNNNLEMVKYLLGDEAKDNQGNIIKLPEGTKPAEILSSNVVNAAANGNLEILKYLVEKIDNIKYYAVSDAHQLAAGNGHFNVVKYLMEKGIYSRYAVRYTARLGNFEMVKYLLGDEAKDNQGNIIKLPEGIKPAEIHDDGDAHGAKTEEIKNYLIQKRKNTTTK